MHTKTNVLIISSIVVFFLAFLFTLGSDWCYYSPECRDFQNTPMFDFLNNDNLLAVFVFLPIFLFSLITYFMREEVFRAWWSFARWMIPIIMIGTILCNMMPSNGGFFNMDSLIYLMVLAPLYSILILGSLWKIIRTHLQLKKAGN